MKPIDFEQSHSNSATDYLKSFKNLDGNVKAWTLNKLYKSFEIPTELLGCLPKISITQRLWQEEFWPALWNNTRILTVKFLHYESYLDFTRNTPTSADRTVWGSQIFYQPGCEDSRQEDICRIQKFDLTQDCWLASYTLKETQV